MPLKERRDFHRRLGLPTDAQSHGLHRLQHEEGGHGGHDVAVHVLDEFDPRVELGGLRDERPPSPDVQPVVILGQGLDSEIATVIEGAADVGGGECGIAHVQNTVTFGDFGYGGQVGQREGGIRWALAEDQLGIRAYRILDVLRVGEIHEAELHPQGHELLAAYAVGPAVAAVGDDAVVASVHESVDAGGGRGHARRNADGVVPVFDFGDLLLEHLDGGVVGATVAVALCEVLVDGLLDEGRGHVDGREYGARLVVGYDAAVDDVRIQGAIGNPV